MREVDFFWLILVGSLWYPRALPAIVPHDGAHAVFLEWNFWTKFPISSELLFFPMIVSPRSVRGKERGVREGKGYKTVGFIETIPLNSTKFCKIEGKRFTCLFVLFLEFFGPEITHTFLEFWNSKKIWFYWWTSPKSEYDLNSQDRINERKQKRNERKGKRKGYLYTAVINHNGRNLET